MIEDAKRLTPKTNVTRELYLKSGNNCAFPGCPKPIINNDGIYVGQLCHIEAAESGGPRFNPDQSNEERRRYDNLLLLCYDHHQITNDEEKYPISKMKDIKNVHEAKFAKIIDDISSSIIDKTLLNELDSSKNLLKINKICKWDLNEAQLKETLQDFRIFEGQLCNLTRDTRKVLSVLIVQAAKFSNRIHLYELEKLISIDKVLLSEYLQILEKYKLIALDEFDKYGKQLVVLSDLLPGWNILADLYEFSLVAEISLDDIIVDMNLSHLDE